MAKDKGIFSFGDLNKEMSKNSKWGGLMSDGAGVSAITEYIHTGNYMLNAAFTGSLFKGIPNNRSIELAGESGTGKTYLLLNMCREAQLKGYNVIFYDSENAVDKDQIINFGIDPSNFWYEPVETVQQFRTKITTVVDTLIEKKEIGMEIPKIFFALDSVGNLATQKEIDDAKAGSDKADMTRAKTIRSIFRILMSKLGIISASFVFTNHIYMTQDLYAKAIAGGGEGAKYGASIIMFLSKAQLKEDGQNKTGIIVTAKPDKNRFCVPHTIKFHISYIHGMNPYVGLDEYLTWDTCGVQRGKFISAKDYEKLPESQKAVCRQHPMDENVYFAPSDSGRKMCTDFSLEGFPREDTFTSKVITKEVLEKIDKVIIKEYKYSDNANDEVMEILGDDEMSENDVDFDIKNQLDD